MNKAIGSSVDLDSKENEYSLLFNECVKDLLTIDEVRQLDKFHQHFNTSRFQHSLNVSYYTFFVCKKLNLDYKSAARGGLLHDLFLYDWRTEKQPEGAHAVAHPKVALRTAQNIIDLNEIEQDAILNHMWPLTIKLPKYKESFIVSWIDKYCTVCEVSVQLTGRFKKLITLYRNIFRGGVYAR